LLHPPGYQGELNSRNIPSSCLIAPMHDKKKHPLVYLIPYLGKYRLKIALGFLMVILTVVSSMFSPWVSTRLTDSRRSCPAGSSPIMRR
jgi:hypothetical protein